MLVFVDGDISRDASFLTGIDSHGQNYNFFAKTFSNIVPLSDSLGAKFISMIFSRVDKRTNFISVNHLAEVTTAGKKISSTDAIAPTQLFLKKPVSINFASWPERDIRLDLMSLKVGATVLEVFTRVDEVKSDFAVMTREKSTNFEQRSKLIGKLVLESEFIASEFGDDQLFFRHQRF